MSVVLKYPELRESPNSDGSRVQPMPRIGAETVAGCPAFPSQDEAAAFNVTLYRLLDLPEPAYAHRVRQAAVDPRMAGRLAAAEKAAAEFVKSRRLVAVPALAVKPASPLPAPAPQQAADPAAEQPAQTAAPQPEKPPQPMADRHRRR